MIESLNIRIAIVISVLVMTTAWIVPSFVRLGDSWWFTDKKITYGLDIQGGLHLVMGVDIDGVINESLRRLATSLDEAIKKEGATPKSISKIDKEQSLKIELAQASDREKVDKVLKDNQFGPIIQILEDKKTEITIHYYASYLTDLKKRVLGQAVETIRNRVDEFGVSEPSITAHGEDRILVQFPGIKDATQAKELINRTARLEFMTVEQPDQNLDLAKIIGDAEKAGNYKLGFGLPYSKYVERLNKDIKSKLPKNTQVLFEKSSTALTLEAGKIPFLVKETNVGGEDLKDAFITFDTQNNNTPQVSFRFNSLGGKKFSDLTEKNVGRQLAVVLDKVIKSAPVVKGKIGGGEGVITLGSGRDHNKMTEEAKMIAMSLRAGALPAALEQLEERVVGPSLGADSIAKGKFAAIVGGILVILFMLLYYKTFGLIADIALALNVLMILACLAALGATLSLPGIAGIALTMGIAVDANVIIFERIKEELQKGGSFRSAIKEGYHKAFSAIVDSNLNSIIVCCILMYYGTGPVRGFAVTLTSGMICSMFTAVFVTHVLFDILTIKFKKEKLWI